MLDEEQALPFVKYAIDAGINFFDTADVYSAGASDSMNYTCHTLYRGILKQEEEML